MQIGIYKDAEETARQVAELFINKANHCIAKHHAFTVALSGGNTPLAAYRLLTAEPFKNAVDWNKVFFFWGDERYVAQNSKENNAYNARKTFLDPLQVPEKNIFPVPTDISPEHAAQHYEQSILKFFGNKPVRFDLVLLGLGNEGHTASLFPHAAVLDEKQHIVSAVYVADKDQYRITCTLPLINYAHTIAFVVCGKEKALITQKILQAEMPDASLPATFVRPVQGELLWLLDIDAASEL